MDLISRDGAINALRIAMDREGDEIPCENQAVSCLEYGVILWSDFVEEIYKIPSVERRMLGRWVKADSAQYFRKHYPAYTCSRCNFRKEGRWNFCPNCGADMRGGNDATGS